MKREEIIRDLLERSSGAGAGQYISIRCDVAREIVAMLKEQDPRVMTREELEDWDGAIFFEAFETDMYYALIENVEPTAGMDGEYVLVNVVPGEHHRRIWGGEHYGSIWRCWTSRPTPEQMRETKWEEDSDGE